jgi:hypothetical protein
MESKKGSFFSAYLVLLVLFMCGFVVYMYFHQSDVISSRIVSPLKLLELEDRYWIFENMEQDFLEQAIQGNSNGKEVSLEKVEEDFLNKIMEDNFIRDFLMSDLYLDGIIISKSIFSSEEKKKDFLNGIYDFKKQGDLLIIQRNDIGKYFRVYAYEKDNEKTFPLEVEFNYAKELKYDLNSRRFI